MCKCRVQRLKAISPCSLRYDSNASHEDPDEAVLKNAEPYHLERVSVCLDGLIAGSTDIEPSKPTPGDPPNSPLTPTAFLEPADRKDPISGYSLSKVGFLTVQVRRYVMAQEREEASDGEGFVAVPDDFEVDCVPVEQIG